MRKVHFLFLLLLMFFAKLSAQTNMGTIFYDVKDYELAKKYFQQRLSENPGEANYFLGEIAFAEGDLDAAADFFNKGMQTNEGYCRIGLAKIELKKGQKPEALSIFLAVQKKYPRDMDILAAIGYAYLDNKLFQDVQTTLQDMQKIDNKNPKIYVLEGDMLKVQDKEASGKYEMALYFDPKFYLAYIKLAEVYEKSNWQIAIEKLNDLLELNPNYILSYRYLGRIYTNNGYYSKAIDAFKKFFVAENYNLDDIAKYVQALFFNKNYEEANEWIKKGLAIAPNHFVLNRLQMYVAAYTLNIEAGLKYAKHFFALRKDQPNEYIALDYSTYGLLLEKAKMYDDALEQYKHALLLDGSLIDIYKDMATIANLKGQYGIAADYFKLFIVKKGRAKVEITDFFNMGRYYYMASTFRTAADTALVLSRYQEVDFLNAISENEHQKDSLLANEERFLEKAIMYYINQADKAFDAVIEQNPNSYLGYFWKARTNSLMDPESENGLAKPYYEKVVELLADREEKTNAIITSLLESYKFLAYFFYIKDDFQNVRLYCEKILEFDAENDIAKTLLKAIKK